MIFLVSCVPCSKWLCVNAFCKTMHPKFSTNFLFQDLKQESGKIHNMNILICTPGRLLQHMDETSYFHASNLQMLSKYKIFVGSLWSWICSVWIRALLEIIIGTLLPSNLKLLMELMHISCSGQFTACREYSLKWKKRVVYTCSYFLYKTPKCLNVLKLKELCRWLHGLKNSKR